MSKPNTTLSRRTFLQSGVTAAAVAGMTLPTAADDKKETINPKKILNYQEGMRYRQLGNTDMYISVISLGGLVSEPGVHEYGIDNGVNLVHVSNSYLGGRSIVDLGKVLKTKRDKVYVALKDNFFSQEDLQKGNLSKIDEWLKVLNTDYVDFFMYNRHDPDSSRDPVIKESFDKLKASGKVRFCGHTSHDKVLEANEAAVESGMFCMLMPVLSYKNLQILDGVLQKAHEKNIGVMAMKTMQGQNSMEEQCAYIKKLLANPAVTTILKGIGSFEMFDAYKKAASEVLTSSENMKLFRYAQANPSEYCMMCGECKSECPNGIEISTVLRCKDYYLGRMNDHLTAFDTYHELAPNQRWNNECGDCRKCEHKCPNGINIVDRLSSARAIFA